MVIVKGAISSLKEKYMNEKISDYLDQVEESILDSLDLFKGTHPKNEVSEDGYIVDYFKDYDVNIILDNSNTTECPVIIETTPSYNNLFGTIEKFSDGHGGWYADFTKIKAGSLLKANGGYLVLNAMDALQEPGVWKSLKRVLLYGKLDIQDFLSYYMFSPTALKPEPIEVNTKVILIGSQYLYHMLANYEDDFKKAFKIKADFDYEMPLNKKTIDEYVRFIKKMIEKEIELGARYAEKKNKLTTRFSFIADLLRESDFWAKDNGASIVTSYHVYQAYNNARERHGLYETKMQEMMNDGIILIDTDGESVGQINGLAVYDLEYFSFGKPSRITSTVSLGNGSIINVEREAGLSGHTHDKGILIISGYFRETFGQNTPLSFAASIVFEQGYGSIDGDSASGAEICTLLSNLSDIPIKQSFAMTGSVNQKGYIQPIGGVNEKIEGFFDVCKKRGLTKKQGVIIPVQNVNNLMLRDDVVDAVKNKLFHIYPVARIEDAVELLTGVKAGKRLQNGSFEKDTLFDLVEKKLKYMHSKTKPPEPKSAAKKVVRKTVKKSKRGK
jgi:ATP-dependent Lon protease